MTDFEIGIILTATGFLICGFGLGLLACYLTERK